MTTATRQDRVETPPERLHRIPLDVYHSMGKLGLIAPADRVVLLDGLLVKKMTKGPRHVTATQKTVRALERILPVGWHVRKEDPISLPDGPEGADSEPEPDVAVVVGAVGDYLARHPGPVEIALIVEVADSSLAEDRKSLHRYAWAGIPCVWIVNLVDETVEVYTGPSGACETPGYAGCEVKGVDAILTVLIAGTDRGPVAVIDLLA